MRGPEAPVPLRSVAAQRRVRRAGSEWREEKGDPGIHVPGTERKSLALTSRSSCPRPCALPQPPSTKDRHTHKPICRTSTFQGEREVKEKKKNPIIFICPPHQVPQKMQTGETAAVNSLYFTQKIVYLFTAYRNYLFEKIYPFSRT